MLSHIRWYSLQSIGADVCKRSFLVCQQVLIELNCLVGMTEDIFTSPVQVPVSELCSVLD